MEKYAHDGVMYVGHQMDNRATIIKFPIADIYSEFGNTGTFTARIQRNGDEAAYPTNNISVSDSELLLTLTASDMAVTGEGYIQIKYAIDTTVVMSMVYKFYSDASLDATEVVPDPWQSWVDKVEEDADRAESGAESAELSEDNAKLYRDEAEEFAEDAEEFKNEAAGIMNLAVFTVDAETGELKVTYPTPYSGATFSINSSGYLEVTTA